MRVSIVAAMDQGRGIGWKNALPWHLPADLRRFKELTLGHYLIMGRKTFASLGGLLPGRRIIVMSRDPDFRAEGVDAVNSFDEALARVPSTEAEVFVAGGSAIYRIALDRADCIYLTVIHESFPADTFFPSFDLSQWKISERVDFEPEGKNRYPYSFLTYERSRTPSVD